MNNKLEKYRNKIQVNSNRIKYFLKKNNNKIK